MKLCIVSDSHDRADPLLQAVIAARREGAEAVLHCGDVIGTHTLRPLVEIGIPVHVIHGNNMGDASALCRLGQKSKGLISYHGGEADLELGGRRIFVTHYPHLARGMACTGDYDLVCCGHTHVATVTQQSNIREGHTWLANPGTVSGLGEPACWILADLATMHFDIRHLQ